MGSWAVLIGWLRRARGWCSGAFAVGEDPVDDCGIDYVGCDLAGGRLEHEIVLAAGGHGAYSRHAVGFDSVDIILSTGPRRTMLAECGLDLVLGTPFGEKMMTHYSGPARGHLQAGRLKGNCPPDSPDIWAGDRQWEDRISDQAATSRGRHARDANPEKACPTDTVPARMPVSSNARAGSTWNRGFVLRAPCVTHRYRRASTVLFVAMIVSVSKTSPYEV